MNVVEVQKGSQSWQKGIRAGDEITSINNGPARDDIDLLFYGSDDNVRLEIHRDGSIFDAVLDGEKDFGLKFECMNVMTCVNRCLFCFIDQNPPGLRKELYLKDEDYRLSFLHGSYITLTSLRESDIERIIEQRLSPLYVSVHATDPAVRSKLLGIRKEDNLLEKIDRLIKGGIRMHCQIVVCPGINDGAVLLESIRELRERFPGILSVAIVPVGLTKFRDALYKLHAVDEKHARLTIDAVDRFHDENKMEIKTGFVYCADEWYVRAGYEVPGNWYYDEFPQYENGVGMMRDFFDSISNLEERIGGNPMPGSKFILVTGMSMSLLLEDFSRRFSELTGMEIRVAAVKNDFFGESVTVSGLLTGKDIISALNDIDSEETVILPPNCVNDSGVFLDDLSLDDIAGALDAKVVLGMYDPVETFSKLV